MPRRRICAIATGMRRCTGTDSLDERKNCNFNVCESFFFFFFFLFLSFLVWRGVFSCSRFFLLVASMTAKKLNWLPFSLFGYFFSVAENHDSTCFLSFRACSDSYAPLGGRLLSIQSLRSPAHDSSVVIVNESGRGRAANRMFASKQEATRATL